MTKTAATKQACGEITMYRQGSGWVVSEYDESVSCSQTTNEMSFALARQRMKASREDRINQLMAENQCSGVDTHADVFQP